MVTDVLLRMPSAVLLMMALASGSAGGSLEIRLPLSRTAYQTNEWIDISVVRIAPEGAPGGELRLTARDAGGGSLSFAFPVAAISPGADARRTEHLHLDGRLLRPSRYALEVACDGSRAAAEIDIYSHVRTSTFRLINWGRATGERQLVEGDECLGYNTFYGNYANDDAANFIRAGIDFISTCTMGGGHQMDLRTECDWSDPLVLLGGNRRVVRRAFIDRTRPNIPGIHFYDEPGLTWAKHPVTGEWTPHGIPSQVRAFRAAFGRDPISYNQVDPANPDDVAAWRHWALWKLAFMDAAWKIASFAISYVKPEYLSLTQTQYGFTAFTDGIYFNAARSLPVASGHGGYDDYGLGYFNPSYTLEMARARDFGKPCWYLPTWYESTPADRFRLEQYLAFMTGIQGLITPPDIDPCDPWKKPVAEGVVESNKLMARLGTIFTTTMPATRPPVAVLYSMSHNIAEQTRDRKSNYAHANKHGKRLPFTYIAGKILKHQFMAVVEEDVLDGTLAAHHRAIVLTSIDHLDPAVIAALESFAANGGLVLCTADCGVKVKGAIDLGVTPDLPEAAAFEKLQAEGKYAEAAKFASVGNYFEGAAAYARAIGERLAAAGIAPIVKTGMAGIAAASHRFGDVEYIFLANAAYDPVEGGMNSLRPVAATVTFASDGRPIYDAVRARRLQEIEGTAAGFRFGPGQLRVFARTARPVGGVQVLPPIVRFDFTRDADPLALDVQIAVVDRDGRMLDGAFPLKVRLLDPFGSLRHRLFRATDRGVCRLSLPLALNDPAGEWKVSASVLLDGTLPEGEASFTFAPPRECGAAAGATRRAVFFEDDRANIFRFSRLHREVTIAVGSSPFCRAAAERLAAALKPWFVSCAVVDAASLAKPRPLSADESPTWIGLDPGRAEPGDANAPSIAGFDIRRPAILVGNLEDNPLIAFLAKQRFLPYEPRADSFPGKGRGMVAWQLDGVAPAVESIALIAHDEEGMSEAAGTLCELATGLEPLTRHALPLASSTVPVEKTVAVPELSIVWSGSLPDRAAKIEALDDQIIRAVTWDGSACMIPKTNWERGLSRVELADERLPSKTRPAPPDAALAGKHAVPGRIVKFVAPSGGREAVGYWGGTVRIAHPDGRVIGERRFDQDLTGLVWQGEYLVVGLADGSICALMRVYVTGTH